MAYAYVDESIHDRAEFIIASVVFSNRDLTPEVFQAIEKVGLRPGVDEYKSSDRKSGNVPQQKLRAYLRRMLVGLHFGLVVIPSKFRSALGVECCKAIPTFARANCFRGTSLDIFFDAGIRVTRELQAELERSLQATVSIHHSQDSRCIGGLQVADLVAHTAAIMLLEQLGYVNKTVKAGPRSGYDPDLEINLGFELWASLRYSLLCSPTAYGDIEADHVMAAATFDVDGYGLHIVEACAESLRSAALERFGTVYLGCIH